MPRSQHISNPKPEKFPTLQLFLLAIVRVAEPIALTSIFPYAWSLIKRFQVGEERDASFYAGLLISAFSLAEALTGMYWGALSDRIGRKPVLLIGCTGTMMSMIMVGFASNVWVALMGRALGGFLNGNIGVIQTMVGELCTRPEWEPRAYSVMPFVWSIGSIIGPAIGGTFASPHDSWPLLFPSSSIFTRFPYLLPNLICAIMLLISIIAGWLLLQETHPDHRPTPITTSISTDETPLFATPAHQTPHTDTYGTFQDPKSSKPPSLHSFPSLPDNSSEKVFTKPIMSLILALGIFSYHSMTYDHLLPIFFEDARSPVPLTPSNFLSTPSGLGLSLRAVGGIMSVQGVIALLIQALVFPTLASLFGVFPLFMAVTALHPLAYAIMPLLVLFPANSTALTVAIYSALTVRELTGIIAYPVLLILIKDAVPSPRSLGRINGLAAAAGAASRTISPPVAGALYGLGNELSIAGLAWWGSVCIAGVGALQSFFVSRQKDRGDEEWIGKNGVVVRVREVGEGSQSGFESESD